MMMQKIFKSFRDLVFYLLVYLISFNIVNAGEVALDFTKGYVGYAPFTGASGNTNYDIRTSQIVPTAFSTAGIDRIRISQTSSTSNFEQGNDYEVTVKIYFSSGSTKSFTMAVNYRHGNTDIIGLILSDATITADDGLSLISSGEGTSNAIVIGLELGNASNSFDPLAANYNWQNTNAASGSALSALQAYYT